MPHEKELLCKRKLSFERYWIPLNWALRTTYERFEAGKIEKPSYVNAIYVAVNDFQKRLQTLCNFDWVPIPLAYPQIVFLAVRIFMIVCLVARQPLIHSTEGEEIVPDIVLPFMTILQIFFFLGWTKVAEQLLNPLGKDDDDLETNWIIDRNITLAMLMAENYNKNPEILYENDEFKKSQQDISRRASYMSHPYKGSVADINFEASGRINMFSTSLKMKMSRKIKRNRVKPTTNDINHQNSITNSQVMTRKRHRSHSYPPVYDKRSQDPLPEMKDTLADQYNQSELSDTFKNIPKHIDEFYENNVFAASFAYHPRRFFKTESIEQEKPSRRPSRSISLESLLSQPNSKTSNEFLDGYHDNHGFNTSEIYYPRRMSQHKPLAVITEEKPTPEIKSGLSKYPTFGAIHRNRSISQDSFDSHDDHEFGDSGYKLGPLEIVEEENDLEDEEEEHAFAKVMRK